MPEDTFDEFWFWFTTIIFFSDVFLSFNTAFPSPHEPGTWIVSRPRIAWWYLRGWFSIDFFSTIPYGRLASLFGNGDDGGGAVRLLKMLKFLRILGLIVLIGTVLTSKPRVFTVSRAYRAPTSTSAFRIMRLMRMLRMSKLRAVWERVEVRIRSIAIIQSIMRLGTVGWVTDMCPVCI